MRLALLRSGAQARSAHGMPLHTPSSKMPAGPIGWPAWGRWFFGLGLGWLSLAVMAPLFAPLSAHAAEPKRPSSHFKASQVRYGAWQLRDVSAAWTGNRGELELAFSQLQSPQLQLGPTRLRCANWQYQAQTRIVCSQLQFQTTVGQQTWIWQGEASLDVQRQRWHLQLHWPEHRARLSLDGVWPPSAAAPPVQLQLQCDQTRLAGLVPLLQALHPPTAQRLQAWAVDGQFSGTLTGQLRASTAFALQGLWQVQQLQASDKEGLHALEKGQFQGQVQVQRHDRGWSIQAQQQALAGDFFYQPVGGSLQGWQSAFSVQMDPQAERIQVSEGTFTHPRIGQVQAQGQRQQGQWSLQQLHATNLQLAPLFEEWIKPNLEGYAQNLTLDGQLSLDLNPQGTAHIQAHIPHLADRNQHWHELDWQWQSTAQGRGQGALQWQKAELWAIPLGSGQLQFQSEATPASPWVPARLAWQPLSVPVLDGALVLGAGQVDLQASTPDWTVNLEAKNLDLAPLAQALQWPPLEGRFSAQMPALRYAHGELATQGQIAGQVFGANWQIEQLKMEQPFGPVPIMTLQGQIQGLDLAQITRAWGVGWASGRVDVLVPQLRLEAWEPTQMQARLQTTPGSGGGDISQKAVQQLGSISGPGGGLQAGLMRFFDKFSYAQLGLGCTLEQGVCTMTGLQDTDAGFLLLQGRGLPNLRIMGYNRRVDWATMVSRLKSLLHGERKLQVE